MRITRKAIIGALTVASLLGGGGTALVVVSATAPAAAVHPAPQAASAIEYGLIAAL